MSIVLKGWTIIRSETPKKDAAGKEKFVQQLSIKAGVEGRADFDRNFIQTVELDPKTKIEDKQGIFDKAAKDFVAELNAKK